jgi:hypothetical protein
MTGDPLLIDNDILEEDDEIYEVAMSYNHRDGELEPAGLSKWTPSDKDEVIVDKLLRETRYYREEIARLKSELASRTASFRFSLARRERSLEAFHDATDNVRRVSPCGVLKTTKGFEKVRFLAADGEILDNDERFTLALNRDSRLVKVEVSAKKAEIAKVLKGSVLGEGDSSELTPADVELIKSLAVMDRSPSTFVIEVPKKL